MSYWNAKYTNDYGEYEITFASKDPTLTKAVEKVCQAIIDAETVISSKQRSRWHTAQETKLTKTVQCIRCNAVFRFNKEKGIPVDKYRYCPSCGREMEVADEVD